MNTHKPRSTNPARALTAIAVVLLTLAGAGCDQEVASYAAQEASKLHVRGIDISHHQGEIDWHAVANSGIDFAWIKATEGGDHLDPMFRRNWQLSSAAGIRRGAYHFIYWCRRADDQAAWFIANVPADPDALPPVLDAEWNPQSRTCPQKLPREQALAVMKPILVAMEKAYGQKPLIYAPADFFDDVMRDKLQDYPLWARSLSGQLTKAYGARRPTVWQHTDTGAVGGIQGDVDENRFVGTREDWQGWRGN